MKMIPPMNMPTRRARETCPIVEEMIAASKRTAATIKRGPAIVTASRIKGALESESHLNLVNGGAWMWLLLIWLEEYSNSLLLQNPKALRDFELIENEDKRKVLWDVLSMKTGLHIDRVLVDGNLIREGMKGLTWNCHRRVLRIRRVSIFCEILDPKTMHLKLWA